MTYGVKGSYGIRGSGGGASLPAWGALPNGIEGDVTAVNVDGEICVAERGPNIWELRAPSATAQAYAATNVMPPGALQQSYRMITSSLVPAVNSLNAKCWAMRLVNTTGETVTTIRIGGRNTDSGHAQIQGAWAIGGTIDDANFQGTVWDRFKFATANTLTPADGSTSSPTFWASDVLTLSEPWLNGTELVIRVQTGTGNVSGVLSWTSSARPNTGDAPSLGMSPDGDYGSSLATAQTNPANWNTGVNGFIAMVELGYLSAEAHPVAVAFGDSVVAGYMGGSQVRDEWVNAANESVTSGWVTSIGLDGYTTADYNLVLQAFVASAWATNVDTIISVPWSWNNQDSAFTDWRGYIETSISAIAAAGKRAVLWIDVPSSLQSGGYGNPTTWAEARAWALTSGTPLIETWEAVATDGTGPTIAAAYSGDGVHLNEAGQIIQGTSMGEQELVLFP